MNFSVAQGLCKSGTASVRLNDSSASPPAATHRVREFSATVNLVANLAAFNPSEFFVAPEADQWPCRIRAWQND